MFMFEPTTIQIFENDKTPVFFWLPIGSNTVTTRFFKIISLTLSFLKLMWLEEEWFPASSYTI